MHAFGIKLGTINILDWQHRVALCWPEYTSNLKPRQSNFSLSLPLKTVLMAQMLTLARRREHAMEFEDAVEEEGKAGEHTHTIR